MTEVGGSTLFHTHSMRWEEVILEAQVEPLMYVQVQLFSETTRFGHIRVIDIDQTRACGAVGRERERDGSLRNAIFLKGGGGSQRCLVLLTIS